MLDLTPQSHAARFKPGIELEQAREWRHDLPQAVAGVAHVLLHLALLPARSRVAELGLEQEVADHGGKAGVDVSLLASAHSVYGGAHVVVDASPRHTSEYGEGVVVRVEQHLVRLQEIGAQVERPAVAELEVRHLQLGAHSANDRPVLAPVELEGLTGTEGQGNEGASAGGLLGHHALLLPQPGKGGNPVVGAGIAQGLQISVHLLDGAPLLAGSAGLGLEPARELEREGVELGRADPLGVVRLGLACAQVLADGIAREARAAGDLSDGQLLSQGPAPDDTQCCHVYHSWSPAAQQSSRLGLVRGSGLDGNPGG